MPSSKLTSHCTASGDLLLPWNVVTFWLSQVLGSGYVVQGLFLLCMLLFLYTRSSVGQERWRVWDVVQGRLHQVYPQRFAWWSKCQIDHQVKRKSWTCELVVFINLVWVDIGTIREYHIGSTLVFLAHTSVQWDIGFLCVASLLSGFGALSWYVKASSCNEVVCRRLHVLSILLTRDPTLNNPSKED